MAKIAITGATGFVGSWLARKLIQDGHDVRLLCRDPKKLDSDLTTSAKTWIGDITDYDSLVSAFSGAERVYHIAGSVEYSRSKRAQMEKINIGGTNNVLKACEKCNVDFMVYTSSVVAIGASKKPVTLNEDSPYDIKKLDLGYFETKRIAEENVIAAVHSGRVRSYIVNPSTIYGPGDFKKGSRKVQLKIALGKFPFYTSGGASIVSITDVIEGLLKVSEKGKPGERHILSGDNLTIKQLFDLIADEMGSARPNIYLPNLLVHSIGKIGDILEKLGKRGPLNSETAHTSTMYHWFDNSKAKKVLGLQPKSAEIAIKESILWLKEHLGEFPS